MSRRGTTSLLAGLMAAGVLAACGSLHAATRPTTPPPAGTATVTGHLSWPACPSGGAGCPPIDGVPVHFTDAAARQTYTAVSDGSGRYSIQLPPGSYGVIAGNADRSPLQRQVTVRRGEAVTLDLPISLPTGLA